MTTYIFWYNHDDEEVVRVGPYLDTAAARDDYPQKPQDGLSRNFYLEFDDSARCAELEEQVAAMKGIVEATGRVAYDCSRDRCADLEAQLQQSRDDYETALREHEKTTAQLRDTQHDANNASMLRDAAELARGERDRVEAENVKLRAGLERAMELRDEARRDCLERWAATYVDDELTEALSIAGVERG